MPAAAVIPAPRVYTKVVAVKKLVVDIRSLWVISLFFLREGCSFVLLTETRFHSFLNEDVDSF